MTKHRDVQDTPDGAKARNLHIMDISHLDKIIEAKMVSAGVARPTLHAFQRAIHQVASGDLGLLPESTLEPIAQLPHLDEIGGGESTESYLDQLTVIKLNGGLGTSMGLEKAKSLMPIKGEDTFLDFIAKQILFLRKLKTDRPSFLLMNSFATQRDSLDYLKRYPKLATQGRLDFLQSRVPKIDASSFEPVEWPAQPDLEWCPPGHGDLYPSLMGSGLLEQLLDQGTKFLFVSNSDNLGATVDLPLLRYFAESGLSFLMEVAERTPSDKKGGHLARRRSNGRLLLRESAQCPAEEMESFQDIERHRFFNTNNLWIQLEDLKTALDQNGGALPLPLIRNPKTLDPKDPNSRKVLQLESAMGAAIECFDNAGAIVVPRTRFSPVKTNGDLLALRSDAYVVTEDFRLVLDPSRKGRPPLIDLDKKHYQVIASFDEFFAAGIPSLKDCESFKVTGPIRFGSNVTCRGTVKFINSSGEPRTAAAGTYVDCEIQV